ncbi:hypothetical protein A7U60_g5039 [Sanghuangporus baumii]|uniref:RRM domain-containing protein n=1 Tax=Sanghuangporus baumii TaxID=108892 RepID=A0A9Q5N4B8_SANBA|nr:hypothetical protein A7U60_g5039 [Sanghuangporus baumii]
MPLTGAKVRSQSAQKRTILRQFSNDSGIGAYSQTLFGAFQNSLTDASGDLLASLTSAGPRTSRESCQNALSFEHVINEVVNPPLLHRGYHSSGPVELGQASNTEQPRGKVRVESWLKEQQRINNSIDDSARDRIAKAAGTPCNPYLAYPGLSKCTVWQDEGDDDILGSFVIVEEDEPDNEHLGNHDSPNNLKHTANKFLTTSATSYASSARPPSLRPSRPASILSVSPWRNLPFTKTLPVRRSSSAPGEPVDLSTPTASLKIGSNRRRSPIPEDFLNTDASANSRPGKTAQNKSSNSTLKAPSTPRSSVRKRLGNLMRPGTSPTVNLASPESKRTSGSPRPSTSASTKTATTSTAVENELCSAHGGSPKRFLPKFNLNLSKPARQPAESVRLDSPTRSSFSATLHHDEPVELNPHPEESLSQPDLPFAPTLSKRRSQQNIFHDRRHNASSSALSTLSIGSIGTLASNINGRASSVFSGSSTAKKKRLVVSGIAPDDAAAMQGLRRWCERFGELRQITRMPNGDLHIDFKRADVADTVCRISARVHIADVGSVNVSWTSGRRH